MPERITINWKDKTITYWWPDHVITTDPVSWVSLYDVMTCGLVNGYRKHEFESVSVLEH
jgi:hypothetical protein